MTTPLVDPNDFGTYLGIDPAVLDTDRATLVLQLAQQLCESVVTPLIAADAAVVLDVATRAWANPTNAQAEGAAPYSVSWGAVSGGLWLTRQNQATLRRNHGSGGAFTFDPTPTDAGTGLQPWDQNVTWLQGVPLAEDYSPDIA